MTNTQAISGFKKVTTRAEYGRGTSWSATVEKNANLTSAKKDTHLGFLRVRLPVFPRIDDDFPSTPHDELGAYCGNRLGVVVGIVKIDFWSLIGFSIRIEVLNGGVNAQGACSLGFN